MKSINTSKPTSLMPPGYYMTAAEFEGLTSWPNCYGHSSQCMAARVEREAERKPNGEEVTK